MSDIRKIITTTLFNKLYHFLIIFIYDFSVMLTILKILERLTCNLSILKQITLSFEYTSPREILHFHDRRPGALFILSSAFVYFLFKVLGRGRILFKEITGVMDHIYLREKNRNLEFNTRFEILSKYFTHFRLYFSSSILRLFNSWTCLVTYHKTYCRPFLQTTINSINNRPNPQKLEPKGTPFFNLRFYSNYSSSIPEKNLHNRSSKPNSFQLRPIRGKALTDKRKKLFNLSRKNSTPFNKNVSLGLFPSYGLNKSYPEKPAGPARPKLSYSRTKTRSNLTTEFPEVGREYTNVGAGVAVAGSLGINRITYLRGWIKDWIKKLRYLQIIGNYRLEENDKILLSILKERKLNLNKKMSPPHSHKCGQANFPLPSNLPGPLKKPSPTPIPLKDHIPLKYSSHMLDLRGETHSSINLPSLGPTSVFLNGNLEGNSEALLSTTGFINSRIQEDYTNYKDLFLLGRQYIEYKFNSSKSTSTLTPKTNIITNSSKFLKSQAYSLKKINDLKGQSLALLQPSNQTGTKSQFITGHADSINRSLEVTNKEMLSANTANLTKKAKALPSSTTKNSRFSPLSASKLKNDPYALSLTPISPFLTLDMENETQMANLSLNNHDESKLSDNTNYVKSQSLTGQNKKKNKKIIPHLRPFNNLRYKEIAPSKLFKLTNPLGQTDTLSLSNFSPFLGPEYLLGETNRNLHIVEKLATSLDISHLKLPLGSFCSAWSKVTWAGDKLVRKKDKQETICFYDYRLRPLNSLLTLLTQKGAYDLLLSRGIALPNSNYYIVGKSVPANMAPQTLSLIAHKALLNTDKFPEGLLIKGSALDKLRKLNLFLVSRGNVDSSLNMTPFFLSLSQSHRCQYEGPDWKALCENTSLVMPLISNKIKNLMSSFLSYKDTNSLAGPYYSHLNLSQIKAKLLMTSFNSLLPGLSEQYGLREYSMLRTPGFFQALDPREIEKEIYSNNRVHHDKLSRAMGKPNTLTFSYDLNDKLNNRLVSKEDMRKIFYPEQGLGPLTSTNKEEAISIWNRSSLGPVDVSWEGEMMFLKKLLNSFFKKMHCLISLPVLEYLPEKLNIRLFYYLKKNAKTYYSASNAINTNMRNLFRNSQSYNHKATYSDTHALLFGPKLTRNNNKNKLGSIIRPDIYIDSHLYLGDNLAALPVLPILSAPNGKNPDLGISNEETKLGTLRLRQLKDRAINIIRLKKYWEFVFNNVPNTRHGVLRSSSLNYTMACHNTTSFSPTTPRPTNLRLHLFSKWRGSNILSPKPALLINPSLNSGNSPLSLPQMKAESFLFSGKIPFLKGILESKLQIYPYSFSPSYGFKISYPQLSSKYTQLRENNNINSSIKPWQSIGPVQLNNFKKDLTKNGLYFQNSILKTVLLRNIAKLNLVLYLSKWKELSPSIIKTKMNVSDNIAWPLLPRTKGIGMLHTRSKDNLLYADRNFSLGSGVAQLHVKNNEALCKKEELSEKEEISGLGKDNNKRTIQALINLEDTVRKDKETYPYDNINSHYSTSGGKNRPLAVEAHNIVENFNLDQIPLENSSRKDLAGNTLKNMQSLTGARVPFIQPVAPPFSLLPSPLWAGLVRAREKEIDANLLDSRLLKENGSLVIWKISGPKLRNVAKILDKESLVTGAFLNTPVINFKGEFRIPKLSPIGLSLQETERYFAICRYRDSVYNSSSYINVTDLNSTKLNDIIPYENINDKLLPGLLLDKPKKIFLSGPRGMSNFLLSLMSEIRYFIQASTLITGSGWLGHRDLLRLIRKNKDSKKLAENIKIINYETLHNIDPIKILDVLELIENIREKRQQAQGGPTTGSIKKEKEQSPECHSPRENTSSLFKFQSTINKTKTLANNKPIGNILYLKTRKGKIGVRAEKELALDLRRKLISNQYSVDLSDFPLLDILYRRESDNKALIKNLHLRPMASGSLSILIDSPFQYDKAFKGFLPLTTDLMDDLTTTANATATSTANVSEQARPFTINDVAPLISNRNIAREINKNILSYYANKSSEYSDLLVLLNLGHKINLNRFNLEFDKCRDISRKSLLSLMGALMGSLLPSNRSRHKELCTGPFMFKGEIDTERDRETQNLELFYKRHIEEIKKLHQELYRTNDFLGALGSVGPYTLIKPLPFREINRRSKGIVAYNKNLFKKLLVFLKVILNKEIELDITRIKNPFNETHILTQILGELTKNNSSKFYRLSKKIIDNAILNTRLTNAVPALRSISQTSHSSINSYKGSGNYEQRLIPDREISLLNKVISNVNFGLSSSFLLPSSGHKLLRGGLEIEELINRARFTDFLPIGPEEVYQDISNRRLGLKALSNFNTNLSLRLGHFRSLDKWSSLSSLNKEIKINEFLAYPSIRDGRQKKLPKSNLTLPNKSITALRSNQNLLWEARDISLLNMDNQTGKLNTKLPVGEKRQTTKVQKSREFYINPTHITPSLLPKDGYDQSPILAYAKNKLSLPLNSRENLSMKPNVDSSNLIEPNTNKSWRKLNLVESSLSGIKLKLSGRLERTAIIPRRTNQELLIGNMSRGSTSFKNDSRLTYKNKRGAYSITVSTSQIMNSRPGPLWAENLPAINKPATDIERQLIRPYPNNIRALAKTRISMDLGRNNNNILSRINRKLKLRDPKNLYNPQ